MAKLFADVEYFGNSTKRYKYEVAEDIQDKLVEGDFVIVNVPRGNTVAQVKKLSDRLPKFQCKKVLAVIDLTD